MSRFLSERYRSLKPYTPGEQPKELKLIKLNTNESPFPPSQRVTEICNEKEVEKLRLYPDPEAKELTSAIADYYSVPEKKVMVGNGSDEILAFGFMAFQGRERKIYFPEISYGFYKVYAEVFGAQGIPVALQENLKILPESFCNRDGMIVIANPNAPTGTCLSLTEIEEILRTNRDHVVLIDEAYVDFGAESCVPLVRKYDNLLVVQTFSKSRSLAGARIGFAIAQEEIIADLSKIKFSFNPYNINRISNLAGAAAMQDTVYFHSCVEKIMTTRESFVWEMKKLGFEVLPSMANFVFVRHDRIDGALYQRRLRENNILVRHFQEEKIRDYVRITIGRTKEMEALLKATRKILSNV